MAITIQRGDQFLNRRLIIRRFPEQVDAQFSDNLAIDDRAIKRVKQAIGSEPFGFVART